MRLTSAAACFLPLALAACAGPGGGAADGAPPAGAAASSEPHATDVAAQILARGGNAVDAAIALHFALAVTYPYAGNLGGGGFLVYHGADGADWFLDFRETAPAAAGPDFYRRADGSIDREASRDGWKAAGP